MGSNAYDLSGLDFEILEQVADIHEIPEGALNIRKDGQVFIRHSSPNIMISSLSDKPGIQVEVKAGTTGESVHVPVLLTQPGLTDKVHNVFIIGENADVTIIAGCGIHNESHAKSQHDGIHEIILKAGARLRYVEKHYGQGGEQSQRVLNPQTIIRQEKNSYCEVDTIQIQGVNSTERTTIAYLADKASIKVVERLLTEADHRANSEVRVYLEGRDSSANILSRSVAKGTSNQVFRASLVGRNEAYGHLECDAIIMDEARVSSIPELWAEDSRATLTHEAAIGKIAGDQIIKLMSLGLSEEDATETILKGFLK